MRHLTAAQAVLLKEQLATADPPPQVLKAGNECITIAAAGGTLPIDLIEFVEGWVATRGAQDRYGK